MLDFPLRKYPHMRLVCLFTLLTGSVWAQQALTVADFFNQDAVNDVFIHTADWQTLQQNFKDDTYYPADVYWRGQVISNVGIRVKGRTSRRATKPGLKVDIDRFQDQSFLGLKAFLLDNAIQDFTTQKERIAMDLFRRMGIPAPMEAHVRVYVNSEYLGLYALVEDTDKRFLKRNFGEDSGYLYVHEFKDQFFLNYLGEDPALYSPFPFKPETKESSPDPAPLVEMMRAINLSSDEEFESAVDKYVDIKAYLTQVAVESFITEVDGITSPEGVNNVYFYRFDKQTRGIFIPKDKDNAFNASDWPVLLNADRHPLFGRALKVPALRQHYFDELLRAADVAEGDGWMEREFLRVADLIRPSARIDGLKECPNGVCSLEDSNYFFEVFVNFVAQQIHDRPAYVRAEVAQLMAGADPELAVEAFRNTGTLSRARPAAVSGK